MQGDRVTLPFHFTGTLAANANIRFKLPFDCQIEHVSMVSSNTHWVSLTIGTPATADLYMVHTHSGISNTPVEVTRTGFVGTQYPHIAAGTIIVLTMIYNDDGTASADVSIVLTLSEG